MWICCYDKRSICEFIVTRIDHIVEYVIPFLLRRRSRAEKNPIVGSKYSNFIIFKQAALIIKSKEHLNPDRKGLDKLLELKKQGSAASSTTPPAAEQCRRNSTVAKIITI